MVTTVVPEKPIPPIERVKATVSTERFQLGLLLTVGAGFAALAPSPAGPLGAGALALTAYIVGRRR